MSEEPGRRRRGRPTEIVRRPSGQGAPLSHRPSDDQPTSAAILDAAQYVLLREGTKGLTLVAVARHAHVDVTTVSYHFGTRAGLIEALMDRLYADPTADFAERASTLDDPASRFRTYLQGVRRMYEDRTATQAYFEIATLALRDPALRVRLGRLLTWTVAAFSEAIAAQPDALPPLPLAELVYAAVDGIEMHHALVGDSYPTDAVLDLLETLTAPYLEGSEPRADSPTQPDRGPTPS
ncbi:TetR/AcrR family transcriptional regulator [Streptomyces sp. NPDC097727]|uniref:TetR/AcrR family transcriptional regulator n=1 Tax=Streptomyces sp. NPDC097727 TaxID=3366092 RepID=UPI0037FC49DA